MVMAISLLTVLTLDWRLPRPDTDYDNKTTQSHHHSPPGPPGQDHDRDVLMLSPGSPGSRISDDHSARRADCPARCRSSALTCPHNPKTIGALLSPWLYTVCCCSRESMEKSEKALISLVVIMVKNSCKFILHQISGYVNI